MKKYLFLSCFSLLGMSAFAQDMHFTQFYASPLTLNPALTGVMEGRYRVGTIYRDQWRAVLDEPIQTFSTAGDFRFNRRGQSVEQDAFGLGLGFVNDRVRVLDFSTTQILLSMAYHKSLGINNTQYLSLGVQGGLTQRNINYESLQFHDEFDGFSGYTLGTGEELPENNFAYTDFNVGLNYSSEFGRKSTFFAGAAYHHFNQPTVSFFKNKTDGDKLYGKYSVQLAANLPIGPRDSRISILPRLLVAAQGPHLQANVGANVRSTMGQYGGSALHFGAWARPVRTSTAAGLDAVVLLMGLEVNSFLLGFSYDLNLQALGANQRQGAFEISINFLGDYESEGILCPKF